MWNNTIHWHYIFYISYMDKMWFSSFHRDYLYLCNVETFNVSLSILGFRVVCATCGRQVQHPEFRLARSK